MSIPHRRGTTQTERRMTMAETRNIERLTAAKAMNRARGNALRRYPAPDKDGARLYPLASPTANPSFKMARSDTVFAIGSCFARNVERALEAANMRVLSREFDLGQVGESLDDAANFYNKYSIHSVTNEIRWALERDTFPGEDILYPMGVGVYSDAQLGMARLEYSPKEILEFRHRYLDGMAQVVEADVVIVTLGYVETWFDTKLGLYLNVFPPVQAIRAEPDRFEFRVLSYGDIMKGLNELYDLLVKHRKKPLKMLITVSPVPLLATFRDMDVLLANAYSKSVQRAALDEFLIGKQGVDYFPSYEFVTLSDPSVAWTKKDYRHVSDDLVDRIMANVIDCYVTDTAAPVHQALPKAPTVDALVDALRDLSKLEKWHETVALVGANRAIVDTRVEALMHEALATRRLEDIAASFEALMKVHVLAPGRPDVLERMVLLCRPLGRAPEAVRLLERHRRTFPDRQEFRDKIEGMLVRTTKAT